jgi:hypothetical protein
MEICPMSNQPAPSQAVMEGDGAYNRHAKLQAGGASLALPFLEKAIKNVTLDSSKSPVVIADYGSSQGKNSLIPMRCAVQSLRKRIEPSRAISVFHIDQPRNDFNSLFSVLHDDPDAYTINDPEVYGAAIGRSFYESVLPPRSVHLGWSSYAVMWLSRLPAQLPDHFIPICSKSEARSQFDLQSAKDWEAFLALRARELCIGGRLLVVLPGIADDGSVGLEPLFDSANAVLEEMVGESVITSSERSQMTLMNHLRAESGLMAPFQAKGEFCGLVLEDCARCRLPDYAWQEYERNGDEHALIASRVSFLRTAFLPSFASALNHANNNHGEIVNRFADELEKRLKRRLAIRPLAMHTLVQVMVFARKS